MSRSVLLLRAVNVSGRNMVPMARLRELVPQRTSIGEVSSYIASGNIICESPVDVASACGQLRALIRAEFNVDTPVIARSHDEIVASLAAQPFADGNEKLVHSMFLEGDPASGALEALTERLLPGEELSFFGRDLWISYSDGGVHSTKLTRAVLDRALGVAGTARNLRTTRTLAELTAHTGGAGI